MIEIDAVHEADAIGGMDNRITFRLEYRSIVNRHTIEITAKSSKALAKAFTKAAKIILVLVLYALGRETRRKVGSLGAGIDWQLSLFRTERKV